jgi:hypothetical protein
MPYMVASSVPNPEWTKITQKKMKKVKKFHVFKGRMFSLWGLEASPVG